MMWHKNGTPARWASDESISARCVFDDCTMTTSQSTATNTTSSSTAATTANTTTFAAITATYTDLSTPPREQPGPPPQSWRAVAEEWRSRSRHVPSLRPKMSSALRRLSIVRRPPEHVSEAHEFCVLKPSLHIISLSELKRATRNFSRDNVVGRGGFAKVYYGSLPGGELVAVKRLTAAGGRDTVEGFLAELGHMVNVSHPNIARLVGVGVDGGEYLVFPFSRLGYLTGKLHGSGGAAAWRRR